MKRERASHEVDRRSLLKQWCAMIAAAGASNIASEAWTQENVPNKPVSKVSTLNFFPGFHTIRIQTTGATINGVVGGSGPPILLLHGWPQTHLIWRKIAPKLSQNYTIVAADLRGYGESSKPPDGKNHSAYSKRSMAGDQLEMMHKLGFDRFAVIGHDRGGRVAHRMAIDYPDAITKLAVLDIVPTYKLYTNVTKDFATVYFHWFFLIQPAPLPETLLSHSAEFFLRTWVFGGLIPDVISEKVLGEYLRCFENPQTLHAMCEDYRAGSTIDLDHDKADLEKKIKCPVLALWGSKGAMQPLFDVIETWKERALEVQGKAISGGHFLPEQSPSELESELRSFLSA